MERFIEIVRAKYPNAISVRVSSVQGFSWKIMETYDEDSKQIGEKKWDEFLAWEEAAKITKDEIAKSTKVENDKRVFSYFQLNTGLIFSTEQIVVFNGFGDAIAKNFQNFNKNKDCPDLEIFPTFSRINGNVTYCNNTTEVVDFNFNSRSIIATWKMEYPKP